MGYTLLTCGTTRHHSSAAAQYDLHQQTMWWHHCGGDGSIAVMLSKQLETTGQHCALFSKAVMCGTLQYACLHGWATHKAQHPSVAPEYVWCEVCVCCCCEAPRHHLDHWHHHMRQADLWACTMNSSTSAQAGAQLQAAPMSEIWPNSATNPMSGCALRNPQAACPVLPAFSPTTCAGLCCASKPLLTSPTRFTSSVPQVQAVHRANVHRPPSICN